MTKTILAGVLTLSAAVSAAGSEKPSGRERMLDPLPGYGAIPLHFEANRGQTDSRVKFLSRGPGYTVFLTSTETVLLLSKPGGRTGGATALRMSLHEGNPDARVVGREELPGAVNDFSGRDRSRWRTGIPTYGRVAYQDVYPGVDLVYYGNQRQLEYDFVVGPGADPGRIALDFAGADRVEVDARGDLVLHTRAGELRQRKPVVYQVVDGRRHGIAGGYTMTGPRQVRFRVAAYDKSLPLVIDPVLIYSTYLGGSADDFALHVAVDAGGNAYVTGFTVGSLDFPTVGVLDTTYNGGARDAFVTKLDPSGSTLLYSTYLGGSADDRGQGVALDAEGNAYIVGSTASSNFPTTPGAFDTIANGSNDGFVAKLDPTGSMLLYSTYLGGVGATEVGLAVAVDVAGHAYLTGATNSPDFPQTPGTFGRSCSSVADAFVTKLDPSGSTLVYSTCFGTTGVDGLDEGRAIAVDTAGNAYLTGYTRINQQAGNSFPTTAGAFDTTYNGGFFDAFVTKVDPSGSALVYSTYLGGSGDDFGNGIAVDAAGNAYVTGSAAAFPTTPGAFDTTPNGGADAFVAKLDPAGSMLVYSTHLGGTAVDAAFAIALDEAANAYVTGGTGSSNFPTTANGFDRSFNGGGGPGISPDGFVTKLDAAGARLLYSTFLGGSGNDEPSGIALDAAGDVYVAGFTTSTNFPTTPGAFQTTPASALDAFVTKLGTGAIPTTLLLAPPSDVNPVGTSHAVTATAQDAAGDAVPDVIVRFSVTGAVNTSGECMTDANGQCEFSYRGPTTPGEDAIKAFADTDGDAVEDLDEPTAVATKTWVPAAPATLVLTPATDTNPAGTPHSVTATVTDAFGNAVAGVTVVFTVAGTHTAAGSQVTDSSGQAAFSYTGTIAGPDTITAYADTDQDGFHDAGEPTGAAGKAWVPGAPATLVLTPAAAENPTGASHSVTATVTDAFGNRAPGGVVRFVVTGTHSAAGAQVTDAAGQAEFSYTGTRAGGDDITAYADSDQDGLQDPGEPAGAATKLWVGGTPAAVTVTPSADSKPVGTEHCVTATVTDASGNPVAGVTVHFVVTGASDASGSSSTDANGQATFCYTGPSLAGADGITVHADTDGDGSVDEGEPVGFATKTWLLPAATSGQVTGGGHAPTVLGEGQIAFGFSAKSSDDGQKGNCNVVDRSADVHLKCLNVTSLVRIGTHATIYGNAMVNGDLTSYRIEVDDAGEPGAGQDTFYILTRSGYTAGGFLTGGNVQVR
jgi:hypothetical protein